MIKNCFAIVTIVAISAYALAQPQNSSTEKEVRQANLEFLRASAALDVAALDRIVADDAIFTDGGARAINKAQVLAQIPRERRSGQKFSNTNIFRATVHGDTAIVVGRLWRPSGTKGGERFIFTNTLIKRNAGWQIVDATFTRENP